MSVLNGNENSLDFIDCRSLILKNLFVTWVQRRRGYSWKEIFVVRELIESFLTALKSILRVVKLFIRKIESDFRCSGFGLKKKRKETFDSFNKTLEKILHG